MPGCKKKPGVYISKVSIGGGSKGSFHQCFSLYLHSQTRILEMILKIIR